MFDEFEFFDNDNDIFESFINDSMKRISEFVGLDGVDNYEMKRNKDGNIELIVRGPNKKIRYMKELTDRDVEKLGKDNVFEIQLMRF